jgi:hypothetical protein
MKKLIGAAVIAMVGLQVPAGAAPAACYTPAAIEAELALRFVTDVMVVSTACEATIYGNFRLRNKDAIIAYQKAMISHFHGAAAFDTWNTALANQASRKQAGMTAAQVCQQAAELLKTAASLDVKSFHTYAVAKAASAGPQYAVCKK